jgi:hypothetical protein
MVLPYQDFTRYLTYGVVYVVQPTDKPISIGCSSVKIIEQFLINLLLLSPFLLLVRFDELQIHQADT